MTNLDNLTILDLLYCKGNEEEEYASPTIRENDSTAERSFQYGVQKVALEPGYLT